MIERVRVTWLRFGRKASHPIQWCWTDEEGTERFFDTKREAQEARAERNKELALTY